MDQMKMKDLKDYKV